MKNKNILFHSILIVILLMCSIGMYAFYPTIKNNSKADADTIINYCIEETADDHIPLDIMTKNTDSLQYLNLTNTDQLSKNDIDQIKREYQQEIDNHMTNLKSNDNIFYQAVDTKTNKTISNTQDNLSSLPSNKELQDKYLFYYQITFENNDYKIDFIKNTDNPNLNDYIYSCLQDISSSTQYTDDNAVEYTLSQNTPNHLTITYAILKDVVPNSELDHYLSSDIISDYLRYSLPYLMIGIIISFITALVVPLRVLENNIILHFLVRVKFLFLAIIWPMLVTFMTLGTGYLIKTTDQDFITILSKLRIESWAPIITPVLNIGYWLVYFLLFLLAGYWLKYVLHKGIKNYLKEDTCIGWIVIHGYHLINKVIQFDFDDKINSTVLKIVGLNFIIMSIISFLFGFSFIITILYSLAIFFILKKKAQEIKEDYSKLLQSTQVLAEGNFDANFNEDLGIFNPLKEKFSHIKEGFEKAVNEEVKSQKMKTELITNVSHDLKTPLTSIITYVDLLKQETLSNEDRNHYLQVLERNSLRLKNLIDDLFEVSKANSGDIKLNYMNVDIQALIKQALLECQDKLEEKNLDIRLNLSDDKIICSLDSSKTYRIFENLIINISKYALENTRVYIDIEDLQGEVKITFKNISEAEINFNEKEIVERFVQGDTSRHSGGSGLGLAIVKSFTEIQKGTFHVEIDGDLFKSIIVFKK